MANKKPPPTGATEPQKPHQDAWLAQLLAWRAGGIANTRSRPIKTRKI